MTNADALVEVAERSLSSLPVQRRERYRVNLFLDPTATFPATWGDGFNVAEAIRRRREWMQPRSGDPTACPAEQVSEQRPQ